MFSRPFRTGILALTLILWSGSTLGQSLSNHALSFAIVPQHSASKTVRLWGPVIEWLSQRSGLELEVVTATDIPEFERRLKAGDYDLAYMNPYHFVVFNQIPGYRAVAHQQNKQIKGIIVTHKDSPVQSLSELTGQNLAFPSPGAFAASILTRANLRQEGINFQPHYVSSHDSVYMTVAKGVFSAGGGVIRTYSAAPEHIRNQLRILWTSRGYTPHAIAAHPRLPETKLDKLREALKAMSEDPAGLQLLKPLKFEHGFVLADDDQWDDIRNLDIDPNDVIEH